MKTLSKTLLSIVFVIIICIFSFSSPAFKSVIINYNPIIDRQKIIIDAGHGGFDGGAVAQDGTVEKDINLSISLKLYEMLKLFGYDVIMTRTTDSGTDNTQSNVISDRKKSDLKERLKLINNTTDGVFVSVHLNKFTTSTARGSQVFYSPNNPKSVDLGESIQKSVISLLQKDNERTIKKGNKSTYLLYNAKIPSVIVECGFLSNSKDLSLLKDDKYQSEMAFVIFCGIQEYFNSGEK